MSYIPDYTGFKAVTEKISFILGQMPDGDPDKPYDKDFEIELNPKSSKAKKVEASIIKIIRKRRMKWLRTGEYKMLIKEPTVNALEDIFNILDKQTLDSMGWYLGESVNENFEMNEKRDKKVTKKMWDKEWKNDYEKRETALLTVFKDPDDAEEWIDMNFDDLPSQASHMTIYEAKKYDSVTDPDDIFFLWDASVDDDRQGIEHGITSHGNKSYSQFIFDDDVRGFDDFEKRAIAMLKKNKWKYDWDGDVLNIYESVNEALDRATTIYQIATPAPQGVLIKELKKLFPKKEIVTSIYDADGYESVLMFDLSGRDLKIIRDDVGDVLVWKYPLGKPKAVIDGPGKIKESVNESNISDTFDLIFNNIKKSKLNAKPKITFKATKRIAVKAPILSSLQGIRDHLDKTLKGFRVTKLSKGDNYPSQEQFRIIDKDGKIYSVDMDINDPGSFDISYSSFNESLNEGKKITAKVITKLSDELAKLIKALKDNFTNIKSAKTPEDKKKYLDMARDLTKQKQAKDIELNNAIENFQKDLEADPNYESLKENKNKNMETLVKDFNSFINETYDINEKVLKKDKDKAAAAKNGADVFVDDTVVDFVDAFPAKDWKRKSKEHNPDNASMNAAGLHPKELVFAIADPDNGDISFSPANYVEVVENKIP